MSSLGIIEGFFGQVWSWRDRLAYVDYMLGADLEFYIYAPKADPFLRRRWSEPWPESTFEEVEQLNWTHRRAGTSFGVGFTPFEAHLDYNDEVRAQLKSKAAELKRLSPDILCVLFDDMKGDVPDLARIQVEIAHLMAETTGIERVIVCPSYYSFDPVLEKVFGKAPDRYLEDLGQGLAQGIEIFWTGPKVCSEEYPEDHLRQVTEVLQRKPFLWDNYPVNDGAKICKFLHLRPFREHHPGLVAGHAANPMNQAWLSQIPLWTLAASYRPGYQPEAAFSKALEQVCDPALARRLAEDVGLLQDQGLDQIDTQELLRSYSELTPSKPLHELLSFLRGEYAFDPACLTD